jgi:hypothetical protein
MDEALLLAAVVVGTVLVYVALGYSGGADT